VMTVTVLLWLLWRPPRVCKSFQNITTAQLEQEFIS